MDEEKYNKVLHLANETMKAFGGAFIQLMDSNQIDEITKTKCISRAEKRLKPTMKNIQAIIDLAIPQEEKKKSKSC